jgi:hypothetical protein
MKLRWSTAARALPPEDRRRLERSIRLAVGRHAPRAHEVRVGLSGDGVDAGPGQLRCRIDLRLRGEEPMRVVDRADDPATAVLRAAGRLGRRLERRDRIAGRSRRPAPRIAPHVSQGGTR